MQKLQKTEKRDKTKRIFLFAFSLEQINSRLFTEATQSHPDWSKDSLLANCGCQLEWTEKQNITEARAWLYLWGCFYKSLSKEDPA